MRLGLVLRFILILVLILKVESLEDPAFQAWRYRSLELKRLVRSKLTSLEHSHQLWVPIGTGGDRSRLQAQLAGGDLRRTDIVGPKWHLISQP